ncbi:MAG: ComEC/Rec2 family competence protein [Prosthecobacter sp.]|jgi:competence protein ComEC|uniref:ComEC/Rec2 family competence protein n=1 Tax=Prosthecobacter sp. TaxID=1965333 RepID=UPI0019EB4E0B|nr:ComEC/Rec2 family competence protein [Prosthecobacter sp.]MBE2284384.1 ComEC/Rec2 family competence protein [Prosthecobacter sp.]
MFAKFQSWPRANPLMVLALAAVAGILASEFRWLTGGSTSFVITTAAVLGLACLCGRAWLLTAGVAMLFAFIHDTRLEETFRHPLRLALQSADKPLPATIRGSLLPDFDTTADGRAHAVCTTQHVEIPARASSFAQTATVLVRLPSGMPFPGAGVYELTGEIYLPRPASNPGTFDAQEFALRNGRVARFEARHMHFIGHSGESWYCEFLETAERCRKWISARLSEDLEDDPETAAVIRAMALGVSAEADDEIEDAFRNSGTLHVFAVSGLHVGLLGVIVLALMRQSGIRRGVSLPLMIALVFVYAFITGWRPSAARAAFMVAVFSGGGLVDRESSLQNSLGAAALLLLGSDTHQLFMPGFQLSFGVLWISSAGSGPLLERMIPFTRLDPFLPPQLANGRQRLWSQFRLWLAGTLSVSIAAWIGSLPFILGHFQSVTPVAVIANCVLVPLSFFCLGATCLSLCAAVLHLSGVQIVLNNINWALAKAMIASAAWFANLPGGNFHFQPASGSAVTPAVWRVLDLPHGGAASHLHAGGRHWLFDTGDETSFRRVLRPYLHSNGIDRIEGVFLSHNDADHVGAIEKVIETFGVPRLFCSTQEPGRLDSSLSSLRRLAENARAPALRKLRIDERVTLAEQGGLKITAQVLYPAMEVENARGDDRAAVLMAHIGPWRVLWMSDAGWRAEKALVNSAADLQCDVLIRSQNEHDVSMSREFLLKARPRVLVCGSDPREAETTLPQSLVDFAREQHVPLLDTWNDGSIALEFGDVLRIVAAGSGRTEILRKP